jgi:predicted DNA-binding transcriptional regulator AlpA
MRLLFCETCHKQTEFLQIYSAIKLLGVSRSTIYYWINKRWIHWCALPSGRRLICRNSLTVPACTPQSHDNPKLHSVA